MISKKMIQMVMVAGYIFCSSMTMGQRTVTSFDKDWKFIKEDIKDAQQENFNDAAWRSLNVPHDWGTEYLVNRSNPSGRGGGFAETGIGWYRKSFTLNETDAKRNLYIEFDGVMANSDVWINGFHLGNRPNGYISFQYALNGHLNFGNGKKNIIAVRADNSIQPSSRWYTGSGIYRHVRLIATNGVHITPWGTFITTPVVSEIKASIKLQTTVINEGAGQSKISIETNIISPEGKMIKTIETKQQITAKKTITVEQEIWIDAPQLWNTTTPNMYKAITKIRNGKVLLDEVITPFGIRQIQFDANNGFSLNGQQLKIKGVCLHHDGGAVGAAVPLRVYERRLELLKKVGVNGIRTSHNAAAPEFLDLCDRMGFVVLDETFDTWNAKKHHAENGYNNFFTDWWERDTRDIVLRDRNHPSVVLYSVGNEVHDNLNDSAGFKKYKMQQDLVHSLDATRPVTMALFRPGLSKVYDNGFANTMDIVGQNYRENELIAAHEKNPLRKVIGTENGHTQAAWLALRDKPFMAGQFLWTGFDYLGEADWPELVNGQGVYDRTGGTRNITYQRESWWGSEPMVYVMRREKNAGEGPWVSDWSPTDIDVYDQSYIQVYSNCDEVELFLNGKSIGTNKRPADNASPRTWTTTFERGTLLAIGKNNGQIVARQELKTAGTPAKILLTADKIKLANSWDDVSYITASVLDENGVPCTNADNQIDFKVTGAGVLAATDNADLTSAESFLSPRRFVYKGLCIAIVKANSNAGKIIITASSANLKSYSLEIDAIPETTKNNKP